MRPIRLVTSSEHGRSEAVNGSRLLNLYVEGLPPNSKTPVVLYGTPGTALFTSLPTSPVLAMAMMDGVMYAATATNLYSVASSGGYTDLGSLELDARVSVATNGIDLVLVDGARGYVYNSADGITQLSGDGWYPANTVTYQDGYFIFNRADTGQFFLSDLLSTELDPLKYATAEGSPDDTLAALSVSRDLWLFGESTTEIWYNAGDPDFPFVRIQGGFLEKGIAAPHSAAKMDNSVIWLGHDRMIYRATGYAPQRISTHAVEQNIAKGTIDDAFAYSYTEEGHAFYVITFPTQGATWVYDAATGLWHERGHFTHGRHHGNCYVEAHGQHLIGDYQNSRIYMLDMDAYTDDGDILQRVMVFPPMHASRDRATMWAFELDMESGHDMPGGVEPSAVLAYSDNGGKTWSNNKTVGIGKIGEYLTRVIWRQLGQFRQRQVKVTISDPIPVVVMGAYAEVEGGRG